ncbi:helix-turn-helix domain-containing protein [Clostridium estertheticum]|uniref:Helix-turn-helix transcriptional regulator n=1 Tax=Clostridium estertheticum TaxID=238834 RepID=A0A7Y3T016_9CLOT|nr:helix-turn-helix transcriptional regulator [Clostridium estertheticum]NNU78168.1 helix-turn-helix transcriptional regulator [Clostridium estertheticum]WBL47719.1 helix-turn-helix domain-containing protein [Clostridium estertheticum]
MGSTEETFGKLIKKLRNESDMSIHELSIITDLSSAYISRIETEERKNPTIYTLNRLKYAFDIDMSVIEKLFPYPEGQVKKPEKEIDSIENLLLNNTYLFAGKVAGIDVQFCLRQLIKAIEQYAIKVNCNREDESNILQLADNLRKGVARDI